MPEQGVGMGVPSPESLAEAEAASDAEMDTALDQIMAADDTPAPEQAAPPAPTEGRVRDASGRFVKQEKSVEAEDGEPEAATGDAGANTEEYQQALRSLQRDKVPQKVLDSLSPEEIVSWGSERAANHLDVDRINSRNAELEQAQKAEAAPDDVSERVKATLDEFSEYFGEDAGDQLKAYGDALTEQLRAGQAEQQEKMQQIIDRMEAQEREEVRQVLADRYDLSDSEWQVALEYAEKDKNEYPSSEAAMKAACAVLFAEDRNDKLNSQLQGQYDKRNRGQPTTQHRSTSTIAHQSNDDLEDSLLDNILDGDAAGTEKTGRTISRRAVRVDPVVGRVGMS